MTNRYTEHYDSKPSVMNFVKGGRIKDDSSDDEINRLLTKSLDYMENNNMTLGGDIIGIFVTRAMEDDGEIQHMLISIPMENNQ